MSLMEKLIRRRITTAMIFLALLITGLLALVRLPVELLPGLSMPALTVLTPLYNAPPGEVENLITARIEEAVSSVNGVTGMTSRSIEGMSIVKVKFNWGRDMDLALIETKEKADLAGGQLPEDAGKSIVVKYDPADEPVMVYSFTGRGLRRGELRRRAEKEIVPYIERIDGVALVDLSGGERREILVEADASRLYSYNLSLPELAESIGAANYSYPAGTIIERSKEYLVRTAGGFLNHREIESVAASYSDSGVPVRVTDVAEVKDSFRDRKSHVRFNCAEGVALLIRKEPGKNTIATCGSIKLKMDELARGSNDDIVITCIYDQSRFISASINSVLMSALLGGIIACVVLWFFLGSTGPPLIIALSIPVSITGTFLLMYLSDISINTMSLGGLALGVGMMVDAGIVVLESIKNMQASGGDPVSSALKGTSDVTAPVAVSVLTSVIVFLPVVFLSGLPGALFRDLALTVSYALFFSLLTSLTLIPMLASMSGKADGESEGRGPGFSLVMEEVYGKAIGLALKKRPMVAAAGIASFSAGMLLFLFIPREIMPAVDPGEFSIEIELPGGTPLESTSSLCGRIENFLIKMDGVAHVFGKAGSDPDDNLGEKISGRGSSDGLIRVFMKDGISAEESADYLRKNLRINEDAEVRYRIKQDLVSSVLSGAGDIVRIEIRGGDQELLARMGRQVKESLGKIPGVLKVSLLSGNMSPGLCVNIDRVRAASLGLDVGSIASSISAALRGEVAAVLRQGDDEIDVRLKLRAEDRADSRSLEKIPVKSNTGVLVPLGAFACVSNVPGFSSIFRREQSRVEVVEALCDSETELNRSYLKNILNNESNRGVNTVLLTGMEGIEEVFTSLGSAMILALVFIYMLLASQFQSLKNPLIVMLSIPVAAAGISLSLLITGESLNINSGIGIIMLCGIVVNNAIVLFDCIEKGILEGLTVAESVIIAGRRRLRPIMMTTLTTVLALLPMALGMGQGAELQRPLAVTVMGGMIFSTMLTLVFMPVLYVMINESPGSAE